MYLKKNLNFFRKNFSDNIFQKNCEIQIHKLNFAEKFFKNKILQKVFPQKIYYVKKFPKKITNFFSKKSFF